MFNSIRNRLIFILIGFTLLPFIILRIVAYPKVQSDVQNIQIRNLDGIAHKQAELVSTWMDERLTDAQVLASNPLIYNSIGSSLNDMERDRIREHLRKVNEYGYKGVMICNDKGIVTISTKEAVEGNNVSGRDYFEQALTGKIYLTDVFPSEFPLVNEYRREEVGLPTMFVTSPIRDEFGSIVGVVALRIDVFKLNDIMSSVRLGKTGETYLVNENGYMITESRFIEHLKEAGMVDKRCSLELKLVVPGTDELTKGVQQCIAGTNAYDAKGYPDYSGISVLGVWRWMPEYNWGIITEIDRDEGYGVAYNLRYIVNAVLLIVAFPLVVVAYLVGRYISNPIILLDKITRKMASGDLSQRVNIKRGDEIGDLANSFNAMAAELDEKTKEVFKSEKRYRELFSSLHEGIYQSEPAVDGVFTYINQAGAEMLGYSSPDEVIGTKVKDIYVDPEDRRKLCEKLEKEGVWREFVSLCKRKNGETFYAERTSSMPRDKEGKPIAIYGVLRDISKRKKTEMEMIESEKRYRVLFSSLHEGIYQSEPAVDGVFTYINQAGAEMLGYDSPEDVIGMKVKDIYVNPEERHQLCEKLEKEGVWREFVSLCKRKNGETFYAERTSSMPRDEEGKPIAIYGVLRDISKRKKTEMEMMESEKRHRLLFNSLKEGIFQCEPGKDGVFTWANQAAADLLGYNTPEELIGTRFSDICVNQDDRKELLEKLEKEGIWRDFTSYCKRKDGERFISEATCNLIRDENGKPLRIEGVFRDITER